MKLPGPTLEHHIADLWSVDDSERGAAATLLLDQNEESLASSKTDPFEYVALIPLLADPDGTVRRAVSRVLGAQRWGTDVVAKEIVKLLGSELDDNQWQDCAELLFRISEVNGFSLLFSAHTTSRQRALEFLSFDESDEPFDVLRLWSKDTHNLTRRCIAEALALAPACDPKAIDLLLTFATEDSSGIVRLESCLSLGQHFPQLQLVLEDIGFFLGGIHPPESGAEFMEKLRDVEFPIELVPLLIRLLDEPIAELRIATVRALADLHFDHQPYVKRLESLLEIQDEELTKAVIECLGTWRSPRSVRALTHASVEIKDDLLACEAALQVIRIDKRMSRRVGRATYERDGFFETVLGELDTKDRRILFDTGSYNFIERAYDKFGIYDAGHAARIVTTRQLFTKHVLSEFAINDTLANEAVPLLLKAASHPDCFCPIPDEMSDAPDTLLIDAYLKNPSSLISEALKMADRNGTAELRETKHQVIPCFNNWKRHGHQAVSILAQTPWVKATLASAFKMYLWKRGRRYSVPSYEIDDIVESFFSSLFTKKRVPYDEKRHADFPAWLQKVFINDVINKWHSAKSDAKLYENMAAEPPERVQNIELLDSFLGQLDEEQREVISMIWLDNLTYGEVAARTGLTIDQVRTRNTKALNRLRRIANVS